MSGAPQSVVLAWLWFKVVKKDQEKEALHFPFHSLFREMFKEYFGFWFEFPYILFPLLCSCAFGVLAGHYPKGPQGPTPSLLKCTRISKNLFSGGILSRGQKGGNPLCHHSAPWCQMQPKESSDVTGQDTSQNTLFLTRAGCPSRDIFTVLVPRDICLCSLFLPPVWDVPGQLLECLSWFWVTQCTFCWSTSSHQECK